MNKPTRNTILHIAPTPFFSDRGCHIRIAGIARCHEKNGNDNVVCTYHHGHEVAGIQTRRISPIAGYTKTSAGPSHYKPWADFKLLGVAFREYRARQPVAIHAHLHEGILIGLLIKLAFFWRRTPLVADMQGSLVGELITYGFFTNLPFLVWPFKVIESFLMRVSSVIICSSPHSMNKFRELFRSCAGKFQLVQDGADPATPERQGERAAARRDLAVPAQAIVAVYSGALLESKGLKELKQIIVETSQQTANIHFLIVGYPTDELTDFLKQHNLAHLCTLTGRIDFADLNRYLSIADIAIDPKISDAGEGSGKMLNYLANRLPVVAFDTQNNREFLGDGATLATDVAAAVQIILKLAQDENVRSQIASANLQRFQTKFSWDVSAGQLRQVYATMGI